MNRLIFVGLTGTTPFDVYVSDIRGENSTLLGTISSTIPPNQTFQPPNIFNNIPEILVKLVDSNNIGYYKILNCSYNCNFTITIVQNQLI